MCSGASVGRTSPALVRAETDPKGSSESPGIDLMDEEERREENRERREERRGGEHGWGKILYFLHSLLHPF